MIKIIPLNYEYLNKACILVDDVFAYDELLPSNELKASLNEDMFNTFKNSSNHKSIKFLKSLEYFIAVDIENDNVVGTTGIYTLENDIDKNIAWLGWFCVDEKYRGRGIGKMLIDFTIDKAIAEGYASIKLYTSDHPSEQIAQALYKKKGFYITNDTFEKDGDYILFYREKILK